MNSPAFWTFVRLDEVCEIGAGNSAPQNEKYFIDGDIPFVRMQDVGRTGSNKYVENSINKVNEKAIADLHLRIWSKDALLFPKSGASILLNHRALLSQPSCVVSHLAVIVPSDLIMPEYLYYFSLTIDATRLVPDGNYPSLRLPDIGAIRVPLPSMPEQQRIVEILRQADLLRQRRKETILMLEQISKVLFYQTFGDPNSNPKGWQTKKLGNVGKLDRGRSKHRPRDATHLYSGNYPFIQTGDIANSNGWITEFHQTYSEAGLAQSRLWAKGTLCITIAATIAKTGILTFDACFPDSIVGFVPGDDVKVEYVRQWFEMIQEQLEADAPQLAQKNINLQILRDLNIPVPPIEVQENFVNAISQLRDIAETQQSSSQKLDELFDSISARGFSGKLTENWRQVRQDELQRSAVERDKALGLRGEKPRRIDFEEGRVTPEELEGLRKALGNFAVNLASYHIDVDGLARSLEEITKPLTQSLVSMSQNLITPFLESFRQSLQNIQLALPLPPDKDEINRQIDLLPLPQEKRAIHDVLDVTSLRVLKLAYGSPVYFTPEDLSFGEITSVQTSASLRVLESLGFVRLVEIDGVLRYRLVDGTSDYAAKPDQLTQ